MIEKAKEVHFFHPHSWNEKVFSLSHTVYCLTQSLQNFSHLTSYPFYLCNVTGPQSFRVCDYYFMILLNCVTNGRVKSINLKEPNEVFLTHPEKSWDEIIKNVETQVQFLVSLAAR